MENSSAIFYPDRAFKRRTMNVPLIAHETAHQWFGDAVTEREWGHLWLSEGFASYWAPLWEQHSKGDSAFRATMARIRDEIIKSPVTLARPVIDTAVTKYMELLNTNSYQKGAWTLHMLRGIVGDSAFFRGVREYYLAHRHGNALTDDLRRAVEHTSGQSLGWFFEQWLRRPGYAELTSSWRWDPAQRRVSITIEQSERFAPYRFPLTVDITGADGRVHAARVEIPAERTTTVVIPVALGAAPRQVDLDPRVELLATIRPR
jgi:aminopeptidase N